MPGATSATILVVDDLDMIRRMLTRMLTLAGHTVIEAPGGAEALALLRAGASVDLVLTDVLTPGMNGTELAARVLLEFPGRRVLLMSAYLPEGSATVGRMGRTVPVIRKPIDRQALGRSVADVLAEGTEPAVR